MTTKRALVTGGTGFVGSHLTRWLVDNGWETHLIVRADSDLSQLGHVKHLVKIYRYTGTAACLKEPIASVRPNVVFHLASLYLTSHSADDVERLINSNVVFAAQLVDAMASTGCLHLINTGTSWQHFEGDTYNPVNLYAATKQAFDDILTYYTRSAGVKSITLNLFDTYGARDRRPKLIKTLMSSMVTGVSLDLSPGHQQIDLVYIDDVVEAYALAARRLLQNEVLGHEQYCVSTRKPISLRNLVEVISEVFGKPINVVWGARPYRVREVMVPWAGGDWLDGWQPKITLPEGLRLLKNECLDD